MLYYFKQNFKITSFLKKSRRVVCLAKTIYLAKFPEQKDLLKLGLRLY